MKYLGMLRFRDQDFKYENDSLDELINYLENYVEDNPKAVIVGIINTENHFVEKVGETFVDRKEYVKSELIDLSNNL